MKPLITLFLPLCNLPTFKLPVSYEYVYVGHVTMFTCVLFSSRVRVRIRFSVW